MYWLFFMLVYGFGAAVLFWVLRLVFPDASKSQLTAPVTAIIFVLLSLSFGFYVAGRFDAFDALGTMIVAAIVLFLLWNNIPLTHEPTSRDRTRERINELLKRNKR